MKHFRHKLFRVSILEGCALYVDFQTFHRYDLMFDGIPCGWAVGCREGGSGRRRSRKERRK